MTKTGNTFTHREAWLHAVAERLRPAFTEHGFPIPPNVRLTCGFPHIRAFGNKSRIGECWADTNSKDGHFEIMVSPVLDDPIRVSGVLTHELIHASVGLAAGHKGPFRLLAGKLGLEGKMTATVEGDAFKQLVAPILEAVGPYPHAELRKGQSSGPKKQGTRLIKMMCPLCAYTVRIARKWLDEAGAPNCPVHGDQLEEA